MLQTVLTDFIQPLYDEDIAARVLQRRLALLNKQRFTPSLPRKIATGEAELRAELLLEETIFLRHQRRMVSVRAAAAPTDADRFVEWFEALRENGPGQSDALFPWLAEQASYDDMCWYLTQEVAGEAGFEDLVALTQIRMPQQAKLELARNYWDEMGRGNAKGMHGPMLAHLAETLGLKPDVQTTVWESLALANTMAGLAADRQYAYHAIGALGVIELTAPARSVLVAQGLRRLGVSAKDRHYFDLHAVLDVNHSAAWNEEVIRPLIAANPDVAPAIAEGALMRLNCGARCFARYRREFGI